MKKNRDGKQQGPLLGSEALGTLARRWREGTLRELAEDWKWIFTFTRRYRWAVACYVAMGIASSSLSLVSALAGKTLFVVATAIALVIALCILPITRHFSAAKQVKNAA